MRDWVICSGGSVALGVSGAGRMGVDGGSRMLRDVLFVTFLEPDTKDYSVRRLTLMATDLGARVLHRLPKQARGLPR